MDSSSSLKKRYAFAKLSARGGHELHRVRPRLHGRQSLPAALGELAHPSDEIFLDHLAVRAFKIGCVHGGKFVVGGW